MPVQTRPRRPKRRSQTRAARRAPKPWPAPLRVLVAVVVAVVVIGGAALVYERERGIRVQRRVQREALLQRLDAERETLRARQGVLSPAE